MPGQGAGIHGGIFLRWKFYRARTPVGEMDSPEANPLAVGLDQVAALNTNEAVLTRGSVVQEGDVGGGGGGGTMMDYVGLEQAAVPLARGEGRGEGGGGGGGGCGTMIDYVGLEQAVVPLCLGEAGQGKRD